MEKVYAFNETVRGHLHVMRDIPCEDYSCSFSDKDGRYYIAAVADGHGSDSCFRSSKGSKIACNVALETLKGFAESILTSPEAEENFYRSSLSNATSTEVTLRRLTDIISAKWYDEVMADYKNNPPTEAELGDYAEMYADGKNSVHIYGTTLIAALMLPSYLILLQQGDGRCDVFYDDGTVNQPIPWDNRCQDTATTSLCDDDVARSFRSVAINLKKENVIACYLGCDGVEDAYRDTYEDLGDTHCEMGGVHTFYKYLTCKISDSQTAFENDLKNFLTDFSKDGKFSRSGSGDDVSVAGIVDLNAISKFTDKFKFDVKLYDIEEQLFWKKDELRGKHRKHEILRKRMVDAEYNCGVVNSEFNLQNNRLNNLKELINRKSQENFEYMNSVDEFENKFSELTSEDESDSKLQQFIVGLTDKFKIKKIHHSGEQSLKEKAKDYLESLKAKRDKSIREFGELNSRYDEQDKICSQKREKAFRFENEYKKAKEAFEEYDSKFQAIKDEIAELEKDRNQLYGELAEMNNKSHTNSATDTNIPKKESEEEFYNCKGRIDSIFDDEESSRFRSFFDNERVELDNESVPLIYENAVYIRDNFDDSKDIKDSDFTEISEITTAAEKISADSKDDSDSDDNSFDS